MKRADWIFLVVAAAMAVAIWYLFVRKAAPLAPGSSKAMADQSRVVGSGLVMPDASDFDAGHYGVDYTQVAY